ncbi:MAG: hypothetical protein JO117_08425 [Verrucomicrobia bacterium]|nr:hypothetical protein [Verrucomicrobiota bacterium]MBV9656539.1 hypothetical protein [Verrucomicrobiota bacterium]
MADHDEIPVRSGRKLMGDDHGAAATRNASPTYRTLRDMESEVAGRGSIENRELVICPNCGSAVYVDRIALDDYPLCRCAYCGGLFKAPH